MARGYTRPTDLDAWERAETDGTLTALVDVVDRGADFRSRLFGSKIALVSGFDVTGRLVSQHPASPYIVAFTLAAYRAVLQRGEPMATVHSPPPAVSTSPAATLRARLISNARSPKANGGAFSPSGTVSGSSVSP